VIIGGLYWRRGTTAGAWAAMVSGSSIAVSGIIIHQFDPDFFINGQMFWALSMAVSSILYVSVSLYGSRPPCDLDRLLHRGRWAVAGEEDQEEAAGHAGGVLRRLGMGPETTTGDRVIIIASYCWTLGWTAVFIVGTIYNLTHDVADGVWAEYWRVFLQVQVVLSLVVIVWFSWGGLRDLRAMLRRLRTMTRDITDDGDLRTDEADGAEGKGNV
jgi:SSS family solute:Na+ symporter